MIVDLETISPMHIGNGNEISPMEYLVGEVFTRIDLDSLLKDPEFEKHYEAFIKGAGNARYIGQYVPARLLSAHPAYRVPFTAEARAHLATNPIQVKEYFKSAGRVLVPGSSVKGAIFSALLFEVLTELWQAGPLRETITGILGKKEDRFKYTELQNLAFGAFSVSSSQGRKDRFFRWIDISDSSLGSPEENLRVFLTKVDGARGDSTLPIVCEALDAEKNFQLEIKTAADFRWSAEDLLQMTDRFYRIVWKKTNAGKPQPEDGILLRLGQGSSAYATSLLLFAERNRVPQDVYRYLPPRTSKQVEGEGNMGWVLLRPAEEQEIQKALAVKKFNPPPPVALFEAPRVQEEVTEVWDNATVRWTPNDQTLHAVLGQKKAFSKGKDLVPEGMRKALFEKKKSVTVRVEVKPVGNAYVISKVLA
jgi:hypothetical protein